MGHRGPLERGAAAARDLEGIVGSQDRSERRRAREDEQQRAAAEDPAVPTDEDPTHACAGR
jgi:hypothetical protein